MDINIVSQNLEREYNCKLIAVINYANCQFAKGLETLEGGISYRYFKICKDNKLQEMVDELLVAYFRKENEINSEDIY